MFGMLGGGFPAMPGLGGDMVFEETYRCYSVAVAGRSELEQGDKSASRAARSTGGGWLGCYASL
jgi:hypothetical protein